MVPSWAKSENSMMKPAVQIEPRDLNWQQKAILERDESDAFLYLVRGENELARE